MKKRLLAIFCILAILLGMIVVPALAETAEDATGYEVGYAKVDVNPWVDLQIDANTTIGISASDASITEELAAKYIVETTIANPMDTSETITQKIIAVPFGGDGVDDLATELMDDNGDGVVGYGDGIFSTCTTVTDAYGKTVVYVTIDCIRASSSLTRKIREAIVTKIGSDNISADQIMVSSSHSHNAPDYDILSNVNYTNTLWQAYLNYVIDRIATATKDAFDNKSAAEMSKGSIEASAAMNTLGYGETRLNYVRHRSGTYTLKKVEDHWLWGESLKTLGTDTIIRTPHSGQDFTKTVNGTKYTATFVMNNEVSEADETLHVLQFTRQEGDPVLLVNWRAHATMNNSNKPALSSDYINRLRYCLENNADQKYCVGFWQGASGNINSGRVEEEKDDTLTPWKLLDVDGLGTGDNAKTNARKYGYLLSQVVLTCLNSMQDCEEGAISTRQALYNAERQIDSDEIIAAANACQAEIDAGTTITYPYAYEQDGSYYVINSSLHLAQVLTRAKRTGTIEMELNVMKLGKDVALVTLPGEPFDRYSNDATMSDTSDNDWDDLIGDVYGTPFVLGYSNDAENYLPNALSYTYAPSNATFEQFYGTGSYESNTAKIAKGQGEALIAELGNMIEVLETGFRSAVCEACSPDTEVKWTPLTQDQLGVDLTSGHYYLAEDITATTKQDQYLIGSDDSTETVCLDMNGNTLDYIGQVFHVYGGSTLNLMDSAEGGAIIARTGGYVQGGVILADTDSTLNLHGGTLQFIKDESYTGNPVGRGGVICSTGHVYMYDGTIIGGEVSIASSNVLPAYNGVGGAVYVGGGTGRFYMYGGHIKAYTGETEDGVVGNCVYINSGYGVTNKDSGGFWLFNDAVVDEIYLEGNTYTSYKNVSFSGKYTGSVTFNFATDVADGEFVAMLRDDGTGYADVSEADLRCANSATDTFEPMPTNAGRLMLTKQIYDAVIDGVKYESLTDAITEYAGGEIQLLRDVTEDAVAENTNTSEVYLDLNGYDIKSVEVAEGTKLICWDFQTYDYTVEDEFGYGIIGSVTGAGTLDTIPVGEDGYVMLGTDTDDDGIADQNVSFHHVDLALTDMTLRPKSAEEDTCNPSMYYKSNFAGDEIVKENVGTFGVALSLVEMPNETNMGVNNKFSWFENEYFQAGGNDTDATSTLLYGIMMESNGRMTNTANASRRIYGRAYIQLADGRYVFGNGHTVTLQALTESADDQWEDCSSEQMEGLVTMYETYQKIMKNWDLTSIPAAYEEYLASKNQG